jgi:ubiquinone/menaquinone biosynthesis C-methylase UbiE
MKEQTLKRTREVLEKHHRDGEAFAQMMKDTFTGRFNDEFWAVWAEYIDPTLPENPTVLDLGTGPGMLLKALVERYPNGRAVGVECAEYMISAVEDLPDNAQILTADLHDPHLELEDNSVDAAVASVVLHEMSQPVRALQEVYRCLKSGGRFYIMDWVRTPLNQYLDATTEGMSVFDKDTPAEKLDDMFIHFIEHNRFTVDDLEFMLNKTGFKVIEKTLLRGGGHARLIAEKG